MSNASDAKLARIEPRVPCTAGPAEPRIRRRARSAAAVLLTAAALWCSSLAAPAWGQSVTISVSNLRHNAATLTINGWSTGWWVKNCNGQSGYCGEDGLEPGPEACHGPFLSRTENFLG